MGRIKHNAITDISIHVPREGDDEALICSRINIRISIHVPREGDDGAPDRPAGGRHYFNPRPP